MKKKKVALIIVAWIITFQSISVIALESEIKNVGMHDTQEQKIRARHEIDRLLEQQHVLTENYEESMKNLDKTHEEYTQLKNRYEVSIAQINDEIIYQQQIIAGDTVVINKKLLFGVGLVSALIGGFLIKYYKGKETELNKKIIELENKYSAEQLSRVGEKMIMEKEKERILDKRVIKLEELYKERLELQQKQEPSSTQAEKKRLAQNAFANLLWSAGSAALAVSSFAQWPLLTSPWFGLTGGVLAIHPGISFAGIAALSGYAGIKKFFEDVEMKNDSNQFLNFP